MLPPIGFPLRLSVLDALHACNVSAPSVRPLSLQRVRVNSERGERPGCNRQVFCYTCTCDWLVLRRHWCWSGAERVVCIDYAGYLRGDPPCPHIKFYSRGPAILSIRISTCPMTRTKFWQSLHIPSLRHVCNCPDQVELIALTMLEDAPEILYGAVTMGHVWVFGTLQRSVRLVTRDLASYTLPDNQDRLRSAGAPAPAGHPWAVRSCARPAAVTSPG
jgi:hypothetical protein